MSPKNRKARARRVEERLKRYIDRKVAHIQENNPSRREWLWLKDITSNPPRIKDGFGNRKRLPEDRIRKTSVPNGGFGHSAR